MEYIIVQAGGKGTRMGYLTKNKPKALVPVENLPMIFYLFRMFPDKRFVIIADYKRDVLRKYLAAFADVKYLLIDTDEAGTCAGVSRALQFIPDNSAFMLTWCDLILPDSFKLPEEYESDKADIEKNYVGISSTFKCRWKYEDDLFQETSSIEHGVAGFFLFRNKRVLENIPESGELVRWMRDEGMVFSTISLAGTREYGLLEEYEKLGQIKTRPFNRISVDGDILKKEPVDSQGELLAKRECAWYDMAREYGITGIPKIYDTFPLRMERIDGKNVYECSYDYAEKRRILEELIDTLTRLHATTKKPADAFSVKDAYYNKTIQRLIKIEDLVPFARDQHITINGKKCKNVFFCQSKLEKALDKLECDSFSFIHGDCTFSNLMIRSNGEPVLIDPRGYFGYTEIYGDERYDWAKLYYSIVGNYDMFNLKRFSLDVREDEVELSIQSNEWEELEDAFFELTGADRYEIKLLHAVIWLSLTTYAWQDYDSICGAFYNGLLYLEEVL